MRQWSYEAMVRAVERRSPSRGTSNQYIFWGSAMVELTVSSAVMHHGLTLASLPFRASATVAHRIVPLVAKPPGVR
jgi:hypothetical protein